MNSNPNPTETPVAINPGIMKEWFKMYLPMRVKHQSGNRSDIKGCLECLLLINIHLININLPIKFFGKLIQYRA